MKEGNENIIKYNNLLKELKEKQILINNDKINIQEIQIKNINLDSKYLDKNNEYTKIKYNQQSQVFPYPICFVSKSLPSPPKDYNLRKTGIDLMEKVYKEPELVKYPKKLLFLLEKDKNNIIKEKWWFNDNKKMKQELNTSNMDHLNNDNINNMNIKNLDIYNNNLNNDNSNNDNNNDNSDINIKIDEIENLNYSYDKISNNNIEDYLNSNNNKIIKHIQKDYISETLKYNKLFEDNNKERSCNNLLNKCISNNQYLRNVKRSELIRLNKNMKINLDPLSPLPNLIFEKQAIRINDNIDNKYKKDEDMIDISNKKDSIKYRRNIMTTRYYKMASLLRVIN